MDWVVSPLSANQNICYTGIGTSVSEPDSGVFWIKGLKNIQNVISSQNNFTFTTLLDYLSIKDGFAQDRVSDLSWNIFLTPILPKYIIFNYNR